MFKSGSQITSSLPPSTTEIQKIDDEITSLPPLNDYKLDPSFNPLFTVPIANAAWGEWLHKVASSTNRLNIHGSVGNCGGCEMQSFEILTALLHASFKHEPSTSAATASLAAFKSLAPSKPHEPEGTLFELASGNPALSYETLYPQQSADLVRSREAFLAHKFKKTDDGNKEQCQAMFQQTSDIVLSDHKRIISSYSSVSKSSTDFSHLFKAVQELPEGTASLLGYIVKKGDIKLTHSLVLYKTPLGINIIDTNLGGSFPLDLYKERSAIIYKDNQLDCARFVYDIYKNRFRDADANLVAATLISYGDKVPQATLDQRMQIVAVDQEKSSLLNKGFKGNQINMKKLLFASHTEMLKKVAAADDAFLAKEAARQGLNASTKTPPTAQAQAQAQAQAHALEQGFEALLAATERLAAQNKKGSGQ